MKVQNNCVSHIENMQPMDRGCGISKQNVFHLTSTLVSENPPGLISKFFQKITQFFYGIGAFVRSILRNIFFCVACRRADFIPSSILNNKNIESEHVRKFNICPNNKDAKDYFELEDADKDRILNGIMGTFNALERENPGAGYKVRFVGSNSGKNPMEAELSAFGLREVGSKMEVSENDPFCKFVKEGKKLDKYPDLTDDKFRVLKTLQDNALIISSVHKKTWFELTISEQKEMLDRAGKLLQKFKWRNGDKLNYELVIHNGKAGHQNVGHVHMHILMGTSRLLASFF